MKLCQNIIFIKLYMIYALKSKKEAFENASFLFIENF